MPRPSISLAGLTGWAQRADLEPHSPASPILREWAAPLMVLCQALLQGHIPPHTPGLVSLGGPEPTSVPNQAPHIQTPHCSPGTGPGTRGPWQDVSRWICQYTETVKAWAQSRESQPWVCSHCTGGDGPGNLPHRCGPLEPHGRGQPCL